MNEPKKFEVLVLAGDAAVAELFGEWLAGMNCRVCVGETDIPSNVGVVRIVGDEEGQPAADVFLPPDVSRRELCTACRLLAQIVQLRRQIHAANHAKQDLKKAAMTDPLTDLPNRRSWQTELERRLAEAGDSRALALAVLDLDHFKRINDDRGHTAGDIVLKAVADYLRRALRTGDFVARLGGDEFGILFWAADQLVAHSVVERVRRGIGSIVLPENLGRVTASAGFYAATDSERRDSRGEKSSEQLFSRADEAMHLAKRAGRDCTVGQ